ncbi:hypothetical protein E3U55_12635 [Filobacillus milosensis]|uniref:Uncharacterized protein n=1 Tax=Filobacillus milosensis TaxID=94137 RepID=A0A4Y8IFA5_9BACI|nr:hypothetical protein [Filobacillus milosensis]TFB15092.1 hypothetical protein E3U55_12635 [Filobacillus milosensis]
MVKSSVDPIILKQQLIHVKSELNKYKKQLKTYQEASPFIELDCLKQEVKELNEQNFILNNQVTILEGKLGEYKKRIIVNKIKNQLHQTNLNQIKETLKSLEAEYYKLQGKYKQLLKIKNSQSIIKVENRNLENKKLAPTHFEYNLQTDPKNEHNYNKKTTSIEEAFHQLLIKNILNWLDVIIREKTQIEYSSVRNQLILILEEKMLKVEKEINDLKDQT